MPTTTRSLGMIMSSITCLGYPTGYMKGYRGLQASPGSVKRQVYLKIQHGKIRMVKIKRASGSKTVNFNLRRRNEIQN